MFDRYAAVAGLEESARNLPAAFVSGGLWGVQSTVSRAYADEYWEIKLEPTQAVTFVFTNDRSAAISYANDG